jgi:ABC-2 type transport system ATP-binding protein
MIDVVDLTKSYGRVEALRGVSFSVRPGERVCLLGHNGAGKSTLMKVLSGMLAPTTGAVRVGGVDVAADPDGARRRLGYVPEEPALYDYLTAREFLELVVSLRGAGTVDEGLDIADLGADADRLIREYSQGMRRRTALAAALVAAPPALVLDEALNGLDPPSSARIRAILHARAEAGAAVLLSTHVLEIAQSFATRVIVLEKGRLRDA